MRMALLRRTDPWVWPLLLMAVIFFFSAQPSLDSGLGWVDLVARKAVHFAEYGLLCFLWWRALRTRMPSARAALVAFAISSLYAASDELHQSFVDGRNGNPVDWAIDSAGAALVALRLRAGARRGAAV
jgi:VanZ family protein